jgi:preprotein translocase subunit YajC
MKLIKRLLKNKKGTAEVVGSVMFIVILLFFFTNVYLWHDSATKQMNQLQIDKMNSGMSIVPISGVVGTFTVTDTGGLDITLSRIWIAEETVGGNHSFVNVALLNVPSIAAGNQIQVSFQSPKPLNSDGSIQAEWQATNHQLIIHYDLLTNPPVRITVLNTLGLTTAYVYK